MSDTSSSPHTDVSEAAPRKLEGWIVLLVEDEPLIGMDVMDTLTDAGATVIGPVRTEAAALEAIDRAHASNRITGAVLDVDLGGQTCQTIAARLSGLDVPYILHTGHWPAIRDIVTSLQAPVVIKPSNPGDIVDTLAET